MRLKLLKLFTILLFAGSSESRPQNFAPVEVGRVEDSVNGWKPIQMRSEDVSHSVLSNSRSQASDSHRQLKDLQYMDQSLRTVATQLLNVTNPGEVLKTEEKPQDGNVLTKLIFVEPPTKDLGEAPETSTIIKSNEPLIFEQNSSKPLSYERPVNSKFGYLESSHPGQAMAMTEDELEKELNLIRHPTHKAQPTTTGGISTWVLLNPPSATTDLPLEEEETKLPFSTDGQIIMKTTASIKKVESHDQKQVTATIEKVTTQPTFEKINTQVPKKSTPSLVRKSTTPTTPKFEKPSTKPEKSTQQPDKPTQKPEKTTQDKKVEKQSTTPKITTLKTTTEASSVETRETVSVTPKTITTTKKVQPTTRTSKPKTSQSQNNKSSTTEKSVTTKAAKPNSQNKPKTNPTRKTTVKPEPQKVESSPTPKIEKVTFRPVQMITTQPGLLEETEVPMFITKMKASVFSEAKRTTPSTPSTSTTKIQSGRIKEELEEAPVKPKPTGSKVNSVLKIQQKKPLDDSTKIEIEPIQVNAPILKIEKVETKDPKIEDSRKEQGGSKTDLKSDSSHELTRIDIETPDGTSSTTVKSTTKRRQTSHKRKKNKNKNRNRKRKPSSTTTESTDSEMSALSKIAEFLNLSEPNNTDNAIQESKIEPETKVATNSTKTKKKPAQKPFSTQIYNFLSREVMPSFGVMSLVGLGLGLASYFLYPFGGSIARRNYDLEPNYKYNLDEYGGNYGQREEDVFSKVLQGMTKHDSKYGVDKEYDNNYQKYQKFDGPYSTTTRKNDQRHSTSSGPIYRPAENSYDVNYRSTEFNYPDLPTTPNYYERQKQTNFAVGKKGNGNRQFVVGSVPKEYSSEEKVPSMTASSKRADFEDTEGPSKFEREMAQNFNFPKNSVNIPQAYALVGTQTEKSDVVYDEIEITPTAVAVEHGPRMLRVRRSNSDRVKRDSVIQVIPSKSEIEKEHREEEIPLSNEILDIIDSAIPGAEDDLKKEKSKGGIKEKMREEEIKGQKKRQQGEKNMIKDKDVVAESTMKTISSSSGETVTPSGSLSTSSKSVTTSADKTESSKTESSKTESPKGETTTSSWRTTKGHPGVKNQDGTTEDWFNDLSTEKPKVPESESYNIFGIMKKIAEIKIKLGLTLLKHASEGFARYLGHVQKRLNGDE